MGCAVSPRYVKINDQRHLFFADLPAEVDDERSTVSVSSGAAHITLVKQEGGVWGKLRSQEPLEVRKKIRSQSIEKALERTRAKAEAKKEEQTRRGKTALEQQMRMEEQRRQAVEQKQEEALQRTAESIREWQQQSRHLGIDDNAVESDATDSEDELEVSRSASVRYDDESLAPTRSGKSLQKPAQPPPSEKEQSKSAQRSVKGEKASAEPKAALSSEGPAGASNKDPTSLRDAPRQIAIDESAPRPRSTVEADVNFTSLEQDYMPAREARERQIKDHKKAANSKISAEATSTSDAEQGEEGDYGKQASVAESEPIFLKEKADAFVKRGDLRGALEIYSQAERAERAAPSAGDTLCRILSNRSGVLHRLDRQFDAIEDCTEAIGLTDEAVADMEGDAHSVDKLNARKAKLLFRRASSLCAIGRFEQASDDYRALISMGGDCAAAVSLFLASCLERDQTCIWKELAI